MCNTWKASIYECRNITLEFGMRGVYTAVVASKTRT